MSGYTGRRECPRFLLELLDTLEICVFAIVLVHVRVVISFWIIYPVMKIMKNDAEIILSATTISCVISFFMLGLCDVIVVGVFDEIFRIHKL